MEHIPVMLNEILEGLSPAIPAEGEALYFDGTLGRGGHLSEMLHRFKNLTAIASDRDPEAIEYAKSRFSEEITSGRLQLIWDNFSEITWSEDVWFNAILLDLGVSSPQLDQGHRGFSFYQEGPLDMRMNTKELLRASDLIHELSENELIQLFKDLGEVRSPYRVVRAIVHDRKSKKFDSTKDLAGLIERVEGWRKKGFHPATQYFMALRLRVNNELESVQKSLKPLIYRLKPKGRMAVLTFHSLEDRIVKNAFRSFGDLGRPVNKKVIVATDEECKTNPRSRSAKLRIFERGPHLESHTSEGASTIF